MLQDVGSSSQGPGARARGGVVAKGIERAAAPRPVYASAPCRCDGEGEAQAAAQGAMHILRWEGEAFVVRDGDEPGCGLRTGLGPEQRLRCWGQVWQQHALSVGMVKCESSGSLPAMGPAPGLGCGVGSVRGSAMKERIPRRSLSPAGCVELGARCCGFAEARGGRVTTTLELGEAAMRGCRLALSQAWERIRPRGPVRSRCYPSRRNEAEATEGRGQECELAGVGVGGVAVCGRLAQESAEGAPQSIVVRFCVGCRLRRWQRAEQVVRARGRAVGQEEPGGLKAREVGQLCEERRLRDQAFSAVGSNEVGMAYGRAQGDEPPGRWWPVAAPDVGAELGDPWRGRSTAAVVDPGFAEVCRDAGVGFDRACDDMERVEGPVWGCDDV